MNDYDGEKFAKLFFEIHRTRDEFIDEVREALRKTEIFSRDVARAIGDISVSEARKGIVEFFSDQFKDKVRT